MACSLLQGTVLSIVSSNWPLPTMPGASPFSPHRGKNLAQVGNTGLCGSVVTTRKRAVISVFHDKGIGAGSAMVLGKTKNFILWAISSYLDHFKQLLYLRCRVSVCGIDWNEQLRKRDPVWNQGPRV